jgi:hypothetical protein
MTEWEERSRTLLPLRPARARYDPENRAWQRYQLSLAGRKNQVMPQE